MSDPRRVQPSGIDTLPTLVSPVDMHAAVNVRAGWKTVSDAVIGHCM